MPLLIGAGMAVLMVALQRFDVRSTIVYLVLGVGIWVAFYESGVHPTLAGVLLGLLTPAVPFQRPGAVSEEAIRVAETTVDDPEPPDADAPQWLRLAGLSREAVSPLARVESALHPWTSFLVVPLFALANAGIELSADSLRAATTSRITLGVLMGLVVGKVIGITAASVIAVRSGVGRLPTGCGWRHVIGMSAVAGIGFTVSLFITDLAFVDAALQAEAKIGILVASVVAGAVGLGILRTGAGDADRAARASGADIVAGHGG
jgi:NhaA family Na+:H+ antiporter